MNEIFNNGVRGKDVRHLTPEQIIEQHKLAAIVAFGELSLEQAKLMKIIEIGKIQ